MKKTGERERFSDGEGERDGGDDVVDHTLKVQWVGGM